MTAGTKENIMKTTNPFRRLFVGLTLTAMTL
ncbi:MAG: hypothetical protein ACJAUW_001499, partial [Yoonia sp.]